MADPFKALTVTYQPGERIITAGEGGACMFVVQRGQVRLSSSAGDNGTVDLATLEKGDFFGEAALLDGRPYGVDADALTEADVVEIGASTFQRMLRANPEIAVRLMRKMSTRIANLESTVRAPIERTTTAPEAAVPAAPPAASAQPEAMSAAIAPAAAAAVAAAPVASEETARPLRARLMVEGGGPSFPLEGTEVLLGRYDPITEIQPEIDLSAFDTKRSVSRRHARIVMRGDKWYVSEEIGALNGTFVNGVKLRPGSRAPLAENDIVSLGMVRLVYRED